VYFDGPSFQLIANINGFHLTHTTPYMGMFWISTGSSTQIDPGYENAKLLQIFNRTLHRVVVRR